MNVPEPSLNLLVLDVGNTNTVVGVFEGAALRAQWRLTTSHEQTAGVRDDGRRQGEQRGAARIVDVLVGELLPRIC